MLGAIYSVASPERRDALYPTIYIIAWEEGLLFWMTGEPSLLANSGSPTAQAHVSRRRKAIQPLIVGTARHQTHRPVISGTTKWRHVILYESSNREDSWFKGLFSKKIPLYGNYLFRGVLRRCNQSLITMKLIWYERSHCKEDNHMITIYVIIFWCHYVII